MAIDTAAKRRSAGAVGYWYIAPGVTPDATPGLEWRTQVAWGYSGIAAAAPAQNTGRRGLQARGRGRFRVWWLVPLIYAGQA